MADAYRRGSGRLAQDPLAGRTGGVNRLGMEAKSLTQRVADKPGCCFWRKRCPPFFNITQYHEESQNPLFKGISKDYCVTRVQPISSNCNGDGGYDDGLTRSRL